MAGTKDEDGLSPRQRKFVELFLCGPKGEPMPAGRAYEAAGYASRGDAADVCASKMLRTPKVAAFVKRRRREMAEAAQIEKWELIDFLTRGLRTPVGEINEDSDLAQEVIEDEIAEQVVKRKIKMVGKLECAKQLATLLQWNAPVKVELDSTAELAELVGLVRKGPAA